jgi:hypothetical protein
MDMVVERKLLQLQGIGLYVWVTSNWVRIREVYSWQKNPPGINCDLIGYDVLNNIPHYKSLRIS